MAIPSTGSIQTPRTSAEQAQDTTRNPRTTAAGNRDAVQQETNVRILEFSLEISIRSGNQSQSLLFRTAIENINERLAPELGPDAIQNAAASGEDFSPEAVANRLLSFATGLFDAFATQRSGEDADQITRDFVGVIREGFERGFGEAREILEGLGVFSGEVESNAMRTFDLFMKGLDDFLAERLGPADGEGGPAA
ncbi:MAG: DUF5610 domain-containing protein [Zoogloeaceae bacterium]|nr:DUF5610 domain-containing protein [Zoogloeaceae bacterium]